MGPKVGLGLLSAVLLAAPAMAQPKRIVAPRVALIGVTQIGDRTEAWLVDRNTKERVTVAPGGTAFGYKVRKIEPEAVVLARGGTTTRVRMGQQDVVAANTGTTSSSHLHARRRPSTGGTAVMETDQEAPDTTVDIARAAPATGSYTDARTYNNTTPQPAPSYVPTYPSYPSYPVYSNSSLITPQMAPVPNGGYVPNPGFFYPDPSMMGAYSTPSWLFGPDGEPWVTPWGTTAPNSTYYPDTSGLLPNLQTGRRTGIFTGTGASMGVPSPKMNPQTLRRRQQLGIR